jgi:hypothetical protein
MTIIAACCCTIFGDNYETDRLATDYASSGGPTIVSDGFSNHSVQFASNGSLIANSASATGRGRVIADVRTISALGGEAVLVGAYENANNYLSLVLKKASPNNILKLYKTVGGVTSLVATFSDTAVGFTTLLLCWNGSVATAAYKLGPNFIAIEVPYTGLGSRAGLMASPNGGTVLFDNLVFAKHSSDDSRCTTCPTPPPCVSRIVPPSSVTLTITSPTCPATPKTIVMPNIGSIYEYKFCDGSFGGTVCGPAIGTCDWVGVPSAFTSCVARSDGTTVTVYLRVTIEESVAFSCGMDVEVPILSLAPFHALGTFTIGATCLCGAGVVTLEVTA